MLHGALLASALRSNNAPTKEGDIMQEKTRYTRAIQLRTAVEDGDVHNLADLLKAAEEAHAEYEKTHTEHDVEWPVWYAQWLLCRRDSFDAACAVSTPVVSGKNREIVLPSDQADDDDTCGEYGGFC